LKEKKRSVKVVKNQMNNLEKAKQIKELVDKTDLPQEAKNQIVMGTVLGVKPDLIIKGAIATTDAIETKKADKQPTETKPTDYTTEESMIHDMLVENTGVNMLDSGGAYGRSWQKNRMINDFRQKPACKVEIHAPHYYKTYEGKRKKMDGEILIYFDLFHYLTAYLELDEDAKKLNEAFEKFANLEENKRCGWLALMEQFAQDIAPKHGFTMAGTFNSYNYENLLSQVIQGTWLNRNNDEYDAYIMLQIHGGCDVRGGYTAPQIFRVTDRDYFIIAQYDVNVHCQCGECNFSSDDGGYNWYPYDSDNKTPLQKRIKYTKDPQKRYGQDKAFCKNCGSEITFSVMDSY